MSENKLEGKFLALKKKVKEEAPSILFAYTKKALKKAKKEHEYKSRKGRNLEKSTKMKKISALSYIVFVDDKIAPYGKYIHGGTKSHKVVPKTTKALRFKPKGKKTWWYSKGHTVKGIKADPFVKNAIDEITPLLRRRLKRLMRS